MGLGLLSACLCLLCAAPASAKVCFVGEENCTGGGSFDEYEKPDGMKCREDLMLYALLNAGAPYLVRDGAYANTDGSFAGCGGPGPEETAEPCSSGAQLHVRVAYAHLVRA